MCDFKMGVENIINSIKKNEDINIFSVINSSQRLKEL
jgi:hypothetical protein